MRTVHQWSVGDPPSSEVVPIDRSPVAAWVAVTVMLVIVTAAAAVAVLTVTSGSSQDRGFILAVAFSALGVSAAVASLDAWVRPRSRPGRGSSPKEVSQ